MSASIVPGLMELRNMIDEMLENGGAALGKASKAKKASTRKGKATPHGDFVKKICEEMKAEVAAFKAANPELKGAHLTFVSNYKKEHTEEYASFESEWKLSHPKDEAPSTEASPSDEADGVEASSDAKPKRVMGDEQKAKMKAGREKAAAVRKAEKEATEAVARGESVLAPASAVVPTPIPASAPPAPAPASQAAPTEKKQVKKAKKAAITTEVVAPVTVTKADEYLPYPLGDQVLLRLGSTRPDGKTLWTSSHLWTSKDGKKGDHYGELKSDNTVDMECDPPAGE